MTPVAFAGLALIAFVAVYWALDRRYPEKVDTAEQGFIALILAIMTLVSFVQVIARYGFNTAGRARSNSPVSCSPG